MKQLLIGAAMVLFLTGCAGWDYEGRPGHDSGRETANDRRLENKASDNLMDVSRQRSPSTPFTSWRSGSMNY